MVATKQIARLSGVYANAVFVAQSFGLKKQLKAKPMEAFPILENAEVLRIPTKIVAVYFLMSAGRVMYVGQTRNLVDRTWLHELDKDFDEVRFLRCDESQLDSIERHYIAFFDPPWKSRTKTKKGQLRTGGVRKQPDKLYKAEEIA